MTSISELERENREFKNENSRLRGLLDETREGRERARKRANYWLARYAARRAALSLEGED